MCNLHVCIVTIHTGTYAQELNKYSRISNSQKSLLEKAFNKSYYLSKSMLKLLAQQSGLSEQKIKTWFHNKRQILKCGRRQKLPSISKYASVHAYNQIPLMQIYLNVLRNMCT